jgi:hypothetical protein
MISLFPSHFQTCSPAIGPGNNPALQSMLCKRGWALHPRTCRPPVNIHMFHMSAELPHILSIKFPFQKRFENSQKKGGRISSCACAELSYWKSDKRAMSTRFQLRQCAALACSIGLSSMACDQHPKLRVRNKKQTLCFANYLYEAVNPL